MTKEKALSLNKYLAELKAKLQDPTIPVKHKNRPVQYKELLDREITKVQITLEAALEGLNK